MQRHRDRLYDAIFGLIVLAALLFCARCAPATYSDPGPFPFEAGDTTALLSGCGERAAVGSLYCRYPAGWKPTGDIVVVVPPVECAAETCASVTIWASDLRKVFDGTIPKGQTHLVIPWERLLGKDPVETRQRGFWPVLVKWSWVDPSSGETLTAAAEGEIRLRVHMKEYSPLAYDPNESTWRWKTGGVDFSATDKGRAAVKP